MDNKFTTEIAKSVVECLKVKYDLDVIPESLLFNETRKEFEGDYTLVIFPLLKLTKSNPNDLGAILLSERDS